jgi:tetratricopeptide (TPR) repeat protein
LGAVNQQLKNYHEAIDAYDMAIANDETDVVSYVYKGESQILMGNIEAGINDLETVVRITEENPGSQFDAWIKRSKHLLRLHKPF